MMKLPGLIDPHVHLRTPGQTQKEDFLTGTSAALAGGYTMVIDMPNNIKPVTSSQLLLEKENIAKNQIVCDAGFYFGSLGENFEEFVHIQDQILGLKVFLNQTTGNYIVDEKVFRNICEAWPAKLPILVHAEENILENVLNIGKETNQKIHVCHISSETELRIIMVAKDKGQIVSCGATPHHLFLTEEDAAKLGSFGKMKPSLKSTSDRQFIWRNLKHVDLIESDHAPHTIEEKQSANPPFGVPGLETTLPLLLTAMNEGKIRKEEIIDKCYTRPKEIFNLPDQLETYIEIDENEEWTIKNENLFTKCKWSPFSGWKIKGKIKRVVIRGTKVFEDGKVLVDPGFGKIID